MRAFFRILKIFDEGDVLKVQISLYGKVKTLRVYYGRMCSIKKLYAMINHINLVAVVLINNIRFQKTDFFI